MLLVVGIGLVVNVVWSNAAVLGTKSDYSNLSLLNQTNQRRADQNEQSLTIDPELTAAAQAKANDMVAHDYWAHNSPDGKTPWSFINAAGYQYQKAGENLAYGFSSAADAVAGWMNSPEHRANILDASYQNVGFGVATSPNFQNTGPQTIIVAEYGEPVGATGIAGLQDNDITNSARPVARIQLLTGGQASWSVALVSAIMGAAIAVFVVRHGFRIKRMLNNGEAFVAHHPLLDIIIVIVITIGFVLTRASGIIN